MVERDAGTGPRRPYRSELREQHAARTRAAITAAARDLFEESGFGGTTIAAIAARAGVSVQTIYATFRTKAGVARAIVEQMQESADAAAWRKRIAAEHEPARILEAFAGWTCAFLAASRPSMVIAQQASSELAGLMAEGNQQRRRALTALVERLSEMDALRPDLGITEAVDRTWLVTGVETFLAATQACGWSQDTYRSWLAETLVQQILRPDC